MGRHLRLPFALFFLAALSEMATEVCAQSPALPQAIAREASARPGRIEGTVTDQAGAALDGASVLAMGAAVATARTDSRGRFALALPVGEYVLRAARDGYISTYREPIRVQPDVPLTRHITLTRSAAAASGTLLLAGLGVEQADGDPPLDEVSEHTHSDMAWRLRHLGRTALRDLSPGGVPSPDGGDNDRFAQARGSLMDWIVAGSARAATAFITGPDFTGQVNFLTTGAMPASGVPSTEQDWARGIAYVVLGAPVGSYGDWSLRAAAAPSDLSSWTFLSEYQARADRTHAFRTGVSYSSQAYLVPETILASATGRRVAGVYGYDRWTMSPRVTLDYGLKIDRYDYLADPSLVSSSADVSVGIIPRTRLTGGASSRMIAPGADQFLPPSASGVWLPPERTFSAFGGGSLLEPERVQRYDIGIEADLRENTALSVRRFSEMSTNQIATLFGLDAASQVGHYYIASPGTVDAKGWTVGLKGQLLSGVSGRLSYTVSDAHWGTALRPEQLRAVSPSSVRATARRGHDLSAVLNANLPASATRVSLALRISNEFTAPSRRTAGPVGHGRFKLEVQQHLPYKPFNHGELNLLIAVRTLLRDLGDAGSIYDELLTVNPPLRLTSGVQMRF
ncbi:MAG: TonB-dependent receptor [Vicinamibacterales bacterium]